MFDLGTWMLASFMMVMLASNLVVVYLSVDMMKEFENLHLQSLDKWKATLYVDDGICSNPDAITTNYFTYEGDSTSKDYCLNVGKPPIKEAKCSSFRGNGGLTGPSECASGYAVEARSIKAEDSICQLYSEPECKGSLKGRISARVGPSCLDSVSIKSFACKPATTSDEEIRAKQEEAPAPEWEL